jgi:hypothetical protein
MVDDVRDKLGREEASSHRDGYPGRISYSYRHSCFRNDLITVVIQLAKLEPRAERRPRKVASQPVAIYELIMPNVNLCQYHNTAYTLLVQRVDNCGRAAENFIHYRPFLMKMIQAIRFITLQAVGKLC